MGSLIVSFIDMRARTVEIKKMIRTLASFNV